ncbi:MAG: hypothetical protein ACYSW4_02460 [Planctomycetota bacterium]|jgi:hypothetical protein
MRQSVILTLVGAFCLVGAPALAGDAEARFFVEVEGHYGEIGINEVLAQVYTPPTTIGGKQLENEFDSNFDPSARVGVHTSAGTFSLRYLGASDDTSLALTTSTDDIQFRDFHPKSRWNSLEARSEADLTIVDFLWSGTAAQNGKAYFGGGGGLRYYDFEVTTAVSLENTSAQTGMATRRAEGDGIGALGMVEGGFQVNDVFSINGEGTLAIIPTDLKGTSTGTDNSNGDVLNSQGSEDHLSPQYSLRTTLDFDFSSGFGFAVGYEMFHLQAAATNPDGRRRESVTYGAALVALKWDVSKRR